MAPDPARHPVGVPVGGQFAPSPHAEGDVTIDVPTTEPFDERPYTYTSIEFWGDRTGNDVLAQIRAGLEELGLSSDVVPFSDDGLDFPAVLHGEAAMDLAIDHRTANYSDVACALRLIGQSPRSGFRPKLTMPIPTSAHPSNGGTPDAVYAVRIQDRDDSESIEEMLSRPGPASAALREDIYASMDDFGEVDIQEVFDRHPIAAHYRARAEAEFTRTVRPWGRGTIEFASHPRLATDYSYGTWKADDLARNLALWDPSVPEQEASASWLQIPSNRQQEAGTS